MYTVKDLKEKLVNIPDHYPVLVHDTRSGVVEEASFGQGEFNDGDDDYGVKLTIGTPTFNIYVG